MHKSTSWYCLQRLTQRSISLTCLEMHWKLETVWPFYIGTSMHCCSFPESLSLENFSCSLSVNILSCFKYCTLYFQTTKNGRVEIRKLNKVQFCNLNI